MGEYPPLERDPGSRWQPSGEVTNHVDEPISSDRDFFAPPPPEIGQVTSAHTSLRIDKKPMSPAARRSLAVAVAAVGVAIGVIIVVGAEVQSNGWQLILFCGPSALFFAIAWLLTG